VSSAAILARQRERGSSARSYARHPAAVPARAGGMSVHGADGRVVLDRLARQGISALGPNHPVAIEAICRVLDSGAPLHVLDLATPIKDEFTENLLVALPPGLTEDARLHFCGPSSIDAVEDDQSAIGYVRGLGLVLGVELMNPYAGPEALGARAPVPALAQSVRAETAQERHG
jgi:4-aminobutyrate aminotransferase-like enzyme